MIKTGSKICGGRTGSLFSAFLPRHVTSALAVACCPLCGLSHQFQMSETPRKSIWYDFSVAVYSFFCFCSRWRSFQPVPAAVSALEPINIEEDTPNKRHRSKKGKRVRFDLNGDALELNEAAQPVDEIQPRTRGSYHAIIYIFSFNSLK